MPQLKNNTLNLKIKMDNKTMNPFSSGLTSNSTNVVNNPFTANLNKPNTLISPFSNPSNTVQNQQGQQNTNNPITTNQGNNTNQQSTVQFGFNPFQSNQNANPQPQQQQNSGINLFQYINSQTPQNQNTNLFNIPQQTNNIQNKPNNINEPPMSFPSNRPKIIQGQFTEYGNSEMVNKQSLEEIRAILTNFTRCMDTNYPDNGFKYMLYNVLPKDNANTIQSEELKRYFPYQINEEGGYNCVDYNLWEKATKYNPNNKLLYPYQISSALQLKNRVKNMNDKQNIILNQYKMIRKNIEEIHQNFEIKAEEKLKVINEKRRLIKEKFLRVIKRIAELADGRKNAMKDTELEKTIQAKLKNLKLNLNDSSEIKKKLDTISTVPSDIYSSESTEQEKDIIKSMSRERMTKNKAMLENVKHLVSVTFENLKSNIATIRGIRNDLDYYKANQHFK